MDTPENRNEALIAFRLYYGALCRALDAGELYAVPASPDFHGFTIHLDGERFTLREKVVGSMDVRAREEREKIIEHRKAINELLTLAEALNHQNTELRALLGNPSESITTVTRDPLTQELISSRTIKRNL